MGCGLVVGGGVGVRGACQGALLRLLQLYLPQLSLLGPPRRHLLQLRLDAPLRVAEHGLIVRREMHAALRRHRDHLG